MAFWHRAHSDKFFFQLLTELTPVSLMESEMGFWKCYATLGHRKTTIFTSMVYGTSQQSYWPHLFSRLVTLTTRALYVRDCDWWPSPFLLLESLKIGENVAAMHHRNNLSPCGNPSSLSIMAALLLVLLQSSKFFSTTAWLGEASWSDNCRVFLPHSTAGESWPGDQQLRFRLVPWSTVK
jgi:hypothetical protein